MYTVATDTQAKKPLTLLEIIQTTPWEQWESHFNEAAVDQAINGISSELQKPKPVIDTVVLKSYFNFIDRYLRNGHSLTLKQASAVGQHLQVATSQLLSDPSPLDVNTLSITKNVLAALYYLAKAPYQQQLGDPAITILNQTIQKMNHTPDFFSLEKGKEPLTVEYIRLLGTYLWQPDVPAIEKAAAIDSLTQGFLKLNKKQLGAVQASEVNDAMKMGLYFLGTIYARVSSLFGENSPAFDLNRLRDQFDQHAQIMLDAGKSQILSDTPLDEVQARALQRLREDVYLRYLNFAHTDDELRALQQNTTQQSPLNPEDIQIVSQASAYPMQSILHLQPADSVYPPLEVALHYRTLTATQLKETETKFAQAYRHFTASWMGSGMPKAATAGPIKIRMYVADDKTEYQRFDQLLGYEGNNGGYALPTQPGDAYDANTYVYQEHRGETGWHIRNAEHELTHGLTYHLLGKQGLDLKFAAFVEGLGEYHAHEKDCYHKAEFINKQGVGTPASLQAILKMDYSNGADVYHWGHLMVGYMVEKDYKKRNDIIKAFQSHDSAEVEKLFQEFAEQEQAGFENWLKTLREQATLDCSVGFSDEPIKRTDEQTKKTQEKQKALYHALVSAIAVGELDEAKALMVAGAPVNPPQGIVGNTPLMYVVTASPVNEELLNLLLSQGARADLVNHENETAIGLAERYGKLELANRLKRNTIPIPSAPSQRDHVEIDNFDKTIIKRRTLMKNHSQSNHSAQQNTVPLNEIAASMIDQRPKSQLTPTTMPLKKTASTPGSVTDQIRLYNRLLKAVRENYLEEVQCLIKQGAPLSDPTAKPGFTPLHYAVKAAKKYSLSDDSDAQNMNMEIINQLLSVVTPTDIDYKNRDGRSAIDVARRNGLNAIAAKIAAQATQRAAELEQTEPLSVPIIWERTKFYMLDQQFDKFHELVSGLGDFANYQDIQGKTLLHHMIERLDPKEGPYYAHALLEKTRINVNLQDKLGRTPLHTIAVSGQTDVNIQNLIDQLCYTYPDIAIDQVDLQGDTPLHVTIRQQNYEASHQLMLYGANIDVPNKAGETPRQLAARDLKLQALVNQHEAYRQLKQAVGNYDISTFASLAVEHPEALNLVDPRTGNTLLHLAVQQVLKGIMTEDIVQAVLNTCRVDIHQKNYSRQSSLDLSRDNSRLSSLFTAFINKPSIRSTSGFSEEYTPHSNGRTIAVH